ncbi:MAG TPA: DUF3099 domain-containing protein [Terrabacter sp.]|nr:DUF3099 domain-containing protein [Terrabacter sp.]
MVYSVTSAPTSTTDDQDKRMKRYLTMMGIRIACFGLVFVTSGWVRWAAVFAAVFIPYIAVVIANAVSPRQPGSVQAVTPQDDLHRIGR